MKMGKYPRIAVLTPHHLKAFFYNNKSAPRVFVTDNLHLSLLTTHFSRHINENSIKNIPRLPRPVALNIPNLGEAGRSGSGVIAS